MGKLSKMEITAVSTQIQKDLRKENQKKYEVKNKEILEEFYLTDIGQKVKFLLDNEDTKGLINSSNLNRFLDIKYYFGVTLGDIERQLIIEQIDCEDTKELIKKVTESFKTEI